MTKVLIAHSCPGMCAGLQRALAQVQDIKVVATASQGEEALQLIRELRPDVVLLDCRLSGALDGIAAAERIQPAGWRVRLLAFSAPGDDESGYRMWQAGAAGCISELAELKSIAKAVEAAARGERLWTPEQIACLQRWSEDAGFRLGMLTGREGEALRLVAQFRTNEEIAKSEDFPH